MNLDTNIILCCTRSDLSTERQFIDMLRSKGVDGIIFTSAHINDPNIAVLTDEGFPMVLVNRRTLPSHREGKSALRRYRQHSWRVSRG